MPGLRFEWDSGKAVENERKHGISFDEAKSIFADEFGVLIDDPDHSSAEERFLLLGGSAKLHTLVVSHCYRNDGEVIRIISARKATRKERNLYNQRWRR